MQKEGEEEKKEFNMKSIVRQEAPEAGGRDGHLPTWILQENIVYSYLSNKKTCPLILFKKKVQPTL